MREVVVLTEVSVAEQVLQKISKFSEILGELSSVQTVCTRLFSPRPRTRAWERGREGSGLGLWPGYEAGSLGLWS